MRKEVKSLDTGSFIRLLGYIIYMVILLPFIILLIVIAPIRWIVVYFKYGISIAYSAKVLKQTIIEGFKHDVDFIKFGIW